MPRRAKFDKMGDIALELLPYFLSLAGLPVTRTDGEGLGADKDTARVIAIAVVVSILKTAVAAENATDGGIAFGSFLEKISVDTGVGRSDLQQLVLWL